MSGDTNPLLLLFFLSLILLMLESRRPRQNVKLEPDKFWKLVRSQEKPVVFLATKGTLFSQICYVFVHEGIVFYSHAGKIETPKGIVPIGTSANFF